MEKIVSIVLSLGDFLVRLFKTFSEKKESDKKLKALDLEIVEKAVQIESLLLDNEMKREQIRALRIENDKAEKEL
ncbi:hypothetical protein [Streptococcus salivarius]|uniref:hypothetical protein n=1 Tax=Streptococcus salivarius TaxID=1304 RepID=UPI0032EF0F57